MSKQIHGTPITPVRLLEQLAGSSFCVSFAAPAQLQRCIELQDPEGMLLLDNGAFSTFNSGAGQVDRGAFFDWANDAQRDSAAAVAVIPDVIGGSEDQNWVEASLAVRHYSDFPERLCFVWHMNDSLAGLKKAAMLFNFVAIGSCAEYDVQTKRAAYMARLREASAMIDYVERFYGRRPWVHLMRGLAVLPKAMRFDSADSTNIARNHCRTKGQPNHVAAMAARLRAQVDQAPVSRGQAFETSNFDTVEETERQAA